MPNSRFGREPDSFGAKKRVEKARGKITGTEKQSDVLFMELLNVGPLYFSFG